MDFGATYVLSEHPRGFVFGDAQDDCLGIYDLDGAQLDRACHEWLARTPLPAGKKRELEAALERRGSPATFRMPDSFPPFGRVFGTTKGSCTGALKRKRLDWRRKLEKVGLKPSACPRLRGSSWPTARP